MDKKHLVNVASLNKHPNPAAQISRMSEVRAFTPAELTALKIVHPKDERSGHLRTFRDLRTQLMKRSEGSNFVCLVTSAAPGGGSHVAVNLAATIALDSAKTAMLMDCNIYSPYADCLLPVPSQLGLTDYLDEPAIGVEEIIYASGIPRMRVVPVGNNLEGGTEKLNSTRMRDLIHEVKHRYSDRYVVVDGPSAADYDAEIRILADLCDFVVLVVPYGKVTEGQIYSAVEKIGKSRMAGVVFNHC